MDVYQICKFESKNKIGSNSVWVLFYADDDTIYSGNNSVYWTTKKRSKLLVLRPGAQKTCRNTKDTF